MYSCTCFSTDFMWQHSNIIIRRFYDAGFYVNFRIYNNIWLVYSYNINHTTLYKGAEGKYTNNKIPRFSDKIDHFFLTYDLVKFRVTKIFHLN